MKRYVKNSLYVLSIAGGIHASAFASVGKDSALSVLLPAYGTQAGPAQLPIDDLLQKCEEFERHEQVAKFTADITCAVDQVVWAPGLQKPLEINYEPSFAEFDISIKGKMNSNWIPIHAPRQTYMGMCPSVEKWRIKAIKTVKIQSCQELRAVKDEPRFCEKAFAESNCTSPQHILTQIQGAQQAQTPDYDDQECHGFRLLEIQSGSSVAPGPVQTEQLESGAQPSMNYPEVSCNQLGLDTPVDMVLKTVEVNKAGQTMEAVQIVSLGELQDRSVVPGQGRMSLITGQFPAAKDILWRLNGRKLEKPEEVCQILSEQKALQGKNPRPNQIKISYYSVNDLSNLENIWEVGTANRKVVISKF